MGTSLQNSQLHIRGQNEDLKTHCEGNHGLAGRRTAPSGAEAI